MNKKLIGLLVILAIPILCFAAADTSRNVGGNVETIVGIGDMSSGYMLEINSNTGAALTTDRAQAVSGAYGSRLVYTGACRIISILVEGESAGDYAAIYDAISATGTPVFDPRIASNTSSTSFNAGGAPFATGIYVQTLDTEVFTSVVYDY